MKDPIEAAQSDSDFWESECKAERARVRVLREALEELATLMEDVRTGDYTPDSFTLQPARKALATTKEQDHE